jgi:hypothetical protein
MEKYEWEVNRMALEVIRVTVTQIHPACPSILWTAWWDTFETHLAHLVSTSSSRDLTGKSWIKHLWFSRWGPWHVLCMAGALSLFSRQYSQMSRINFKHFQFLWAHGSKNRNNLLILNKKIREPKTSDESFPRHPGTTVEFRQGAEHCGGPVWQTEWIQSSREWGLSAGSMASRHSLGREDDQQ